ncbi:MAG TPA: toll/interleukin-1 receptor domain-containing protein [Pyrinomonadaceae bacterium]|jgi:hypothetical protein|nr:toll/interleukin-1 receptor domain-containing protein [Pyrinomonadaceae bacterium]
MSFEYDIFISYGHLDDENPDDVKGWVDMLVERLPGQMQGHLAYKPRVWRDERSLRGNDLLQAAIREGVESSLLFVPVVTPRYVLSGWCRRELEMFCASQPPDCPSADAFRSRIFKVIKMPLTMPHVRDKEPEQLSEMVGYEFYEMEGDMPVEFSPDVQPAKDMRYWTILRRLAWEMTEMLGQLKPDGRMPGAGVTVPVGDIPIVGRVSTFADFSKVNAAPVAQDSAASNGNSATPPKVVYLAETTSDLSKERELVRDELRQRGYGVLPEKKLPIETSCEALASAVRADVERCTLSVHLVGVKYGSTPEDDERSVVRIQEELAVERSASAPDFRRIIWMPPGLMTPALEVKDSRQKEFVTELQSQIGEGSELLQTSVEDLKTRIVEKLDPPRRPPVRPRPHEEIKQVYLICEDNDSEFVEPIRDYLIDQNFDVLTNLDLDGETASRMEYHRRNLLECDAALIYFGAGDALWVRKNLDDLDKAFGLGREDDWSASAVYVGAPESKPKSKYRLASVPVIRNFDKFNPEDLRAFISAVQSAEGGQVQ